jgi:hypothetical protein
MALNTPSKSTMGVAPAFFENPLAFRHQKACALEQPHTGQDHEDHEAVNRTYPSMHHDANMY